MEERLGLLLGESKRKTPGKSQTMITEPKPIQESDTIFNPK